MSKTRMGKRVASLLLSLVMMLSLLPTTVYATMADGVATNDEVVEETIAPVNAEGVDAVDSQEAESSEDEQPSEESNEATSFVTVNDTSYATLEDAIAAATPDANGVITYTITGKVEVNTDSGWVQVLRSGLDDVSAVKFVGTSADAEISLTGGLVVLADQQYDIDVSFENLTLSKPNPAYGGDYGHSTNYFTTWLRNSGAAENTVTYTDCTFPNGVCNNQYGKTVFDNCQFTNTTTKLYNLWVYGGNVELNGGKFSGTRGAKVYTEGTPETVPTVNIKGTAFDGLTEKAAIVVSKAATVTLTDVNATGCSVGLFQKDIEGSGETTTITANGEKISGEFNITAEKGTEAAKEEFNITAGTFTSEVSSDYLAEGLTIGEDGTVKKDETSTELTNYATIELTFGSNVSAEDIAAAKALYDGKQYETCKAANEAYMALFGVTWGEGYLDVTDNTAPLYKYAGVSGSVAEVKYYIHGTMAGFTSLQSSGNQIDCTVGGNHQIFRTSVSIIGVNDANGNKAKLTDGNVQAYVAGGYDSMFTMSGKLTIDNIAFTTTTSTTVGASATTATSGSNKKATGEMEIKNCTFNGRLYVYDNFDNTGMTYNIHNNVFDGSNYSGDDNAYAIFAQCRGGNELIIEGNTIGGFARGINIDHANVAATIKGNTISITDAGRSCIQLSSLTKAEITDNTLNLTGGNAVTLHEKLLTMTSAPEISFTGNIVTGTGYLVYDDAKANNKSFTSENLVLTVGSNEVANTVDTTQGVKDSTVFPLGDMVNGVVNPAPSYVAKIGGTGYETLAEAVEAANADDTITLVADVTLDSALTINKNVTIDLDGHTVTAAAVATTRLSSDGCYAGIIVNGAADVKFQNGTLTSAYTTYKDGTTNASYSSYVLLVDDTAKLTLVKVTVTGQGAGDNYVRASGGICYDSTGSLSVLNGTVTAGASNGKGYNYNNPAAIFTVSGSAGSVKIDSSTVTGGAAAGIKSDKDASPAINAYGSVNVTISGGSKLTGGASEGTAGNAVEYRGSGKLTVTGSTLIGGSSTDGIGGSALYEQSPTGNAVIEVADSTITGGDGGTSYDGSGISCNKSATITVKNSTVKSGNGENATGNAAAITLPNNDNANLTLEDTTLSGVGKNMVVKNGLYSDTTINGTLTIAEGKLENLAISAAGDGATIEVSEGASVDTATVISTGEKALEAQGDGNYSFTSAAAQVIDSRGNKMSYATLAAAIAAAKDGETVKLLADTKENVTISKALTLDLNGYTLNGGTEKGRPALTVTARVTVKDSSEAQTGTIKREDTAENSGVSSHYVIDIQGDSWLTFEGGNVKNNSGTKDLSKGASLVRVGDDSVAKYPGLNIKGGTFTQDNFIVIKVDRGDLFLNGGTLNSDYTYAIENWHSTTISGGTVNGAVAAWTYSGGANSSLTIEGGTINGDVKSVNYGNSTDRTAKVSISGGTVKGALGTYIYSNGGLATTEDTSLATIAVSGGTFDRAVEERYCAEGFTPVENEGGTYGVEQQVLAKIDDTEYYTMAEAFKAVKAGETIVMQRDYVTSKVQNSGDDSFTIDLSGHTWTFTSTDVNEAAFEINYPNVTLTVKNGTVVSGTMVGLIPTAMGGSITYDNAGLVFEDVIMTANGHSGIETNGGNTNDAVTLKNSTLNVPNGFGIYFPSSGTLTIDNSVINAKTMGVQVCAGSLNIIGDKTAITVTGDAVTKTEGDGAIEDGAAISIVNRTGYKGLVNVTVENGTFTSKVAAIKAYDWANNAATDFTANETVAVSGGTFSSAVPEGLCAEGFAPKDNGDGSYTVAKAVAEYNGTKYETLQAAIDAAVMKNGGQAEVTLLDNLTITETVNFANQKAASVLLNLGGYTLTGNGCRALQINKGLLCLENGIVTSTGIINSSSVIRIGSNEDDYSGAQPLLQMNRAKVLAPDSYGVTIFGSKTVSEKLTVGGNAVIKATGPSPAISGNGGTEYNKDKGTIIVVTGNAVVSATNNYAIYHPDNGSLSIQNTATVTGKGGIQMCSGTLNISYGSPKIKALGKADHETGAAGPIYDIAAISVVNRGYPGGAPVVTIKGTPTITTVDGEVIHAYTWSNNAESEWAEAGDNINVFGGTYSKTFNEAYLAADCTLVAGENGSYTVEQEPVAEYNGTQYTSLSQALTDARNNGSGTVKLLKNVTQTTYSLDIGKVTLNLNKKTLTLDGGAQLYTSGAATINNGTIKRIDTPTIGSANDFAIQVMSGGSLILGTSSTYKVALGSTYGIYNAGGTLNVRYATITTDGWSIAVSDSTSKTGEVIIGLNATTNITSKNGNCIGTAVNSKPNVTIHKGTLTSNGTAWDAGVIYWASEGTLTIEGGTFTASNAEGSTAAAVYQKNGTVKISGATTKLLGNNALVVAAGDGSTGTMVTELSGGTYSTKPEEAWVVEGKEIHETADGMYKVEGEYVVEVTHADGTTTSYDAWSKLASVWNESGATIKLLKDTTTSEIVATNGDITIDFNGKTLTVTKETSSSNYEAAIVVQLGGKLTLKDSSEAANGGMTATNIYGVEVITGSSVTVMSGSYNCDTSVVQVDDGTAYIKGGTFQTEAENKSFLLNCTDDAFKDGTAKIEVTGGTFYGFDPSANPEGEGTTYVKTGYVSTDNGDGTYTVEEYLPVEVWTGLTGTKESSYATIKAAAENLGNNKWIVIGKDYTLTEDFTIPKDVFLDVASGATLTVAEGVTLTVAANAKRLGVRDDAEVVNNGTILVLGTTQTNGTVSKVGSKYNGYIDISKLTVKEGMILVSNGAGVTYYAAEAVFEVTYADGTTKKIGKESSWTGATKVTLLKDVNDFAGRFDKTDKLAENFVLDLGGHTLTGKTTAADVLTTSVPMTIQNGTIKYAGPESAANGALYTSANVTIASDVTIYGGASYAIWTAGYSGATLTVNGTVKSDGGYAITGNGRDDSTTSGVKLISDCNIVVNDGAMISASNGVAIYHPEKGTVTINGGTISGHTGVQMCSGELFINGGSIETTDKLEGIGNDGGILDGAAVSIINRGYPGGVPTATISGGTFTSADGIAAVQAYTVSGTAASDWTDVADYVNISGGTFSNIPDNMAALCKIGYRAVEDKDNNVYIVKEGKYVIEVTSRIQGTNQTVATPTGGGQADYGEEVTVTTYAVTGFTFLGWYDSEGNLLYKDNMTYMHKVTGDCKLIAVYAQDNTRMFQLTVNGNVFTVNGDEQYTRYNEKLSSGTQVVIEYTGTDNFLYWVNASKNIVTTSKTLNYTMVNDAEFTAVTAPATSNSAIVVFKNNIERGQELQAKRYKSSDSIVFPVTPSSYGKTFAYWAILDADGNVLKDEAGNAVVATESAIKAKIAEGTGYIVVAAVYTANGYYKATAHFVDSNGNTVADDMVNANVPTGSGWQVTAPDVKNKFFSCWKDVAGSILSTSQTYTIYAMDTVEVTAVYVDSKDDKEPDMSTVMLTASTEEENGGHTIVLSARYDIAADKVISEVGILFTTSSADANDTNMVTSNTALRKSIQNTLAENSDIFRLHINNIKNLDAVVYARAYVITVDGETIYSGIINGSFNSWSSK